MQTNNSGQKISFEEFLVQVGALTPEVLSQYINEKNLDEILAAKNILTEQDIKSLRRRYSALEYVDINNYKVADDIIHVIPEKLARKYNAVALAMEDGKLIIGMSNPLDFDGVDNIARSLEMFVVVKLVKGADLAHYLNLIYRGTQTIEQLAQKLSYEAAADAKFKSAKEDDDEQATTTNLLHTILEDAVRQGASDVHIEEDAYNRQLRIRMRVDGQLQEQLINDHKIAGNLFRRLKVMAGLNLMQDNLPQEGGFSDEVNGVKFNFRLSSFPNFYGQSAVIRLLGQVSNYADLQKIIPDSEVYAKLQDFIAGGHGMMLVTGPTGSGKTTTLYSTLMSMNDEKRKIISLEDPVETVLPRINQIMIKPEIGLDFSDALRGILRQDPDVIMVGEVRDRTTATMTVRAAITGHLVFATVHTNDTISSIVRLKDLGVDSFLLAASIRLVTAQRLVKTNCQNCQSDYALSDQDRAMLKKIVPDYKGKLTGLKFGKGCRKCRNAGVLGRTGVFEMLPITSDLIDLLSANDFVGFRNKATEKLKGKTLVYKALDLALKGIIPVSEIFRLVSE